VWYLWCGKDSPAFDKNKMATFERYFLKEKELHKETKGYYYTLRENEDVCEMLLNEFGVEGPYRHIINGHVPIKAIKGETPIKNSKMMVIDGGFSKAYHSETGIAGYTLVYHSRGFQLIQHEPFTSMQKAIEEGQDIKSSTQIVEMSTQRMMVKDTDKGRNLSNHIFDLRKLLLAYRIGLIKERTI
jgi:fructose-1,6-bisphosphatase-3